MKNTLKNWFEDRKYDLIYMDRRAALKKFGASVMLVAAGFGIGRMVDSGNETNNSAPVAAVAEANIAASTVGDEAKANQELAEDPMRLGKEEWATATEVATQNVMSAVDRVRDKSPNPRDDDTDYRTEDAMRASDDAQVDKQDGEHVFTSGEQTLDGGADIKIWYSDDRSGNNIEKDTTLTFHVEDGHILDDNKISYEELTGALQADGTVLTEATATEHKYSYDEKGNFLDAEETGIGYERVAIDKSGKMEHLGSTKDGASQEQQAREALTTVINSVK